MAKDRPDSGTWFQHNDEVYAALYTKRDVIHPSHAYLMMYVIQRTWGHKSGKVPRQRTVFPLDRTDAAEVTGLGRNFCSYFYALIGAHILYEDEDGQVGVENRMERWELDRLKANPKQSLSALLEDEAFLSKKKKLLLDRKKLLLDKTTKQQKPTQEAPLKTPLEREKESRVNSTEKAGKKSKAVGAKDTPDNPSDPINAIASKLYDTFAEKRGYKKEVNWLGLRNMIKTLLSQGYTEEQMVGCLIYLATVDNYFKDGKVDWSLMKIKDKIGWYVKNVHEDKTTTVKSEGSTKMSDLYKQFKR